MLFRSAQDDQESGKASEIMVGVDRFPASDLDRLRNLLGTLLKSSKGVEVDLRADKNLEYAQVAPVMMTIRDVGVTKVNLVALPSK